MRLLLSLSLVAATAGLAVAQCPPTCTGGGGPATTDCFLAYGNAPGKVITCTEGDPSCDTDGKIDGVCTFGFTACTNAASAPARHPARFRAHRHREGHRRRSVHERLAGLSTTTPSCTEPGLVKLAIALAEEAEAREAHAQARRVRRRQGRQGRLQVRVQSGPPEPRRQRPAHLHRELHLRRLPPGAIPERSLRSRKASRPPA
jgi:hypothetical protein